VIAVAFSYSVAAFVWVAVLVTPGGLLDFIPLWFARAPEKVVHVLFQCEKCFAGQLALWTYPVLMWKSYQIFDHILVVLFSIFFAAFIGKIYSRL